MSLPPLSNVIVVGGSFAGLMHALIIQTHAPQAKITILERSPTSKLHNRGVGIVAGAETQELFSKYVCPEREIAVASPQRLYLDRKGNEIPGSVEDWPQHMTNWELLYRLLRWRVNGVDASEFFDGVPPANDGPKATYCVGSKVTAVRSLGEHHGVEVQWTDSAGLPRHEIASLLIAADGAGSFVRQLLDPSQQRKYAGYVALRGMVPESKLSEAAAAVFVERFPFFHSRGNQALGYTIPGPHGRLERGARLVSWVWYRNLPADGAALRELLTDTAGRTHNITLPLGGMQPAVWDAQVRDARVMLPPQFAELVAGTVQPFVQAIADVLADRSIAGHGQILIVGDARAGFRPHTAASASQAARSAMLLGRWIDGTVDGSVYERECTEYAERVQRHGVTIGDRSQFGSHPLADNS